MKIRILILSFLLITSQSYASWFIVDLNNNVAGKVAYQPDSGDLSTRQEIAVTGDDDISLGEAEYRNGKIVKHTKTVHEEKAENDEREKSQETKLVYKRMMKNAYEQLKAEGVNFKHVKPEDFE